MTVFRLVLAAIFLAFVICGSLAHGCFTTDYIPHSELKTFIENDRVERVHFSAGVTHAFPDRNNPLNDNFEDEHWNVFEGGDQGQLEILMDNHSVEYSFSRISSAVRFQLILLLFFLWFAWILLCLRKDIEELNESVRRIPNYMSSAVGEIREAIRYRRDST